MRDLSELLDPIDSSNPSGVDTRYTPVYDQIKEARREELDLPQGIWARERKIADWDAVIELCSDALINRTKDIQIASWLTEGLIHKEGYPGLAGGLNLLSQLLDKFWGTLYPRSQEDELECRAGPLEWVGSRLDLAVKRIPLVASGADWFELDQQLKTGSTVVVDGTVVDYPSRVKEVRLCSAALERLEAICASRFGEARPRFDGLRACLRNVELTLDYWFCEAKPPGALEAIQDSLVEPLTASACMAETGNSIFSGAALDMVHFTLSAPPTLKPLTSAIVSVWAHLESHRAIVVERACQQYRALNPANITSVSKGPIRMARGVLLNVRLEVPNVRIEDPEDSVLWDGEVGCANFILTLSASQECGTLPGRVLVYLNGVQITKIHFVLNVGVPCDSILTTKTTRIQKAFASYASADRDEVLARLQGILKVVPYLEIFFDILTLRSGQNWLEEIERLIPASDVFYLFWSLNASASTWVEREWRTALRTGRRDLIDPVPLQTPEEAPPPPELASLHFNDWMLAFRRRKVPQNY